MIVNDHPARPVLRVFSGDRCPTSGLHGQVICPQLSLSAKAIMRRTETHRELASLYLRVSNRDSSRSIAAPDQAPKKPE
jgi:hypothetical protein